MNSLERWNSKVKWFRDLREVALDYKRFKLFELSLIWRASLDKKSWGKQVHLGRFQEDLRAHLFDEDPGPQDYVSATLIDLRDQEIEFEGIGSSVELLRKNPCHVYRMHIGGYDWTFFVGKDVPRNADIFCLQATGHLRIIVVDGRPRLGAYQALMRTLPQ